MSDLTFRDLEVVAVTIFIRDIGAWLWRTFRRAYRERRIEPQKAHQQVFVDQADWFEERAAKLAAFSFQLGQDTKPDKFRLAEFVSRLDQHDREWAMKQTDVDLLRKCATEKGAECHDNARECRRLAEEIEHRIFWL